MFRFEVNGVEVIWLIVFFINIFFVVIKVYNDVGEIEWGEGVVWSIRILIS